MIHFTESYNSKNMAQGAPTQIVDASGTTLQLVRDPQRNLQEIRGPRGQWIKLRHDDQARVVRAENDAGDWVGYRYNTDGSLTDVTFSDGRARHYTYVGELLTWVRDETGRVLIHNWYEGGVVRQDYSSGESYRISYTPAENQMYAEEATVTLPDGSTRSFRTGGSVPQYVRDIRSGARDDSWRGWLLYALKWW